MFVTILALLSFVSSSLSLYLIYELTKNLRSKRRLDNPSDELQDFLADINEFGYAVVRVDPGAVFLRGRKN